MTTHLLQKNKLHPFPNEAALQGARKRVAFVTGAGQGLGRAIAVRLAKDGLDVAVNDINSATLEETKLLIEAEGAKSIAVVGDVSDEPKVSSMIAQIVTELGYLDVLVANAGIARLKPFLDNTLEDLDQVLSINTRSVFICYQQAARQMIKQGTGGKLIAASSIIGVQAREMNSTYCASKFAVRGITQAVAIELAPHGITANCYAPGVIVTPMVDEACGVFKSAAGGTSEEALGSMLAGAPLGRVGIPDDIANVVSFLASRNSDYMTGQTMLIDGGMCFS